MAYNVRTREKAEALHKLYEIKITPFSEWKTTCMGGTLQRIGEIYNNWI